MKHKLVHSLVITALAASAFLISILNLPRTHTAPAGSVTTPVVLVTTEPPYKDIWERILERYDRNGNGKIDNDEYIEMWRDLQQEEQGQPGFLDTTLAELIAWLISLGFTPNEANNIARDIMTKYDANGDGILDSQEWKKFWEDLKRWGPQGGVITIPGTPIIVIPEIPGVPGDVWG